MRVGLISDIHGNLEALQAVLDVGREHGVEQYGCLGDVVGYGADPAPCLSIVQSVARFTLAGNHDLAACGRLSYASFNPMATEAIVWTQQALSESERALLADLPMTVREDDVLFVHGSPHAPEAFHYIFGATEAAAALKETDARLTFVGHSHRAFVYGDGFGECAAVEGSAWLDPNARYLVNVGSVGQPRDGDRRAAFCVWDTDYQTVELIRVAYDAAAAGDKIIAQGLPSFLATRLMHGT